MGRSIKIIYVYKKKNNPKFYFFGLLYLDVNRIDVYWFEILDCVGNVN